MASSKKSKKSAIRVSTRIDLRVAGGAGALLAGAIAAWLMWAGPAISAGDTAREQIAAVEQQTLMAQSKIGALRSGQASDGGQLLAQARQLDAQLPQQVDKVTLAAQVPTAAAARGLTVAKMDPAAEPVVAGSSGSLAFAMEVSGEHGQLMSFLEELTSPENPSGLMTLEAVSLSTSEQSTTATFTLNAHYTTAPTLAAPGQ